MNLTPEQVRSAFFERKERQARRKLYKLRKLRGVTRHPAKLEALILSASNVLYACREVWLEDTDCTGRSQ